MPVGATARVVYTPITGILLRSEQIVAGHGCGTGPNQVYKYAAVLSYTAAPVTDDAAAKRRGGGGRGGADQAAAFSTVVPCYTDGVLSNLPPNADNSESFDITIYAFNQASYPSALDDLAFADDAGAVVTVIGGANWTTTCAATQQSGITVVALCQPLEPVGGEAEAGTEPEAGPQDDAEAGPDAAPDAGPDAADAGGGEDAPPDGPGDAMNEASADGGDAGPDGA